MTVRGETWIEAEVETETNRVWLKIEADVTEYHLLYSLNGQDWFMLASGTAYALSPEDFVDKMCFTGVIIGLYATGNGRTASEPAYFDWFEYQAHKKIT
ncbi:hypothetical protein D3C76_1699760 [compost metagenome]